MSTRDRRQLFPPPVSGVHAWLFGCAATLCRDGLDQITALSELSAHVAGSTFRTGRNVTTREIAEAIEAAYRDVTPNGNHSFHRAHVAAEYSTVTGWPAEMSVPRVELDHKRLGKIFDAAGNFELVDLWERSPVRPPDPPAPRWVLGQLFADSDVLCIGSSASDFAAKPLCVWEHEEMCGEQLIVPNPLRKLTGTTKRGTESAHSRDATGPRRYIVIESDTGFDHDQQAQILEHLRTESHGRLAAVVMSGGKSLHGWFRCDGVPPERLYRWFGYACSLGADPRLWLPEQFVRLPDGRRDNGKRQSVIYINPTA